VGEPLPSARHRRLGSQAQRVPRAVQAAGLAQQDREQLSSRQVAANCDIRNPNQVVVWRRNLDQGRLQARGSGKEEQPKMKPERRAATPSSTVVVDAQKSLPEENDRLRAEVAYLKKYCRP
jgi:transposase